MGRFRVVEIAERRGKDGGREGGRRDAYGREN